MGARFQTSPHQQLWIGTAGSVRHPSRIIEPRELIEPFVGGIEYAGGQIADWGAHHVDIAQWAMGQDHTGPIRVEGTATWNQELSNGMPARSDTYNTPIEFNVTCWFDASRGIVETADSEVPVTIDSGRNGITFEGEEGRFFVNRGTLEGIPVDGLRDRPLPTTAVGDLTGKQRLGNHMENFVDAMKTRHAPIASIQSHHRTVSTCHLANLALRLGRSLTWDAAKQVFKSDEKANTFLSREPRAGYGTELG